MTASIPDFIRENSEPLEPNPTAELPKLTELSDIRAVLFDVYGTMLVSGAGDVGLVSTDDINQHVVDALSDVDVEVEDWFEDTSELFRMTIEIHQQQRQDEGGDVPEVDILEVWRDVVESLSDHAAIDVENLMAIDFKRLAVAYEARVNPVWPMAELEECLEGCHHANTHLGIISNAQFFTPQIFPALMGRSLEELGFDPDLQIFSYRHLEAKPGRFLFDHAVQQLAQCETWPEQCLFIGNDMLNDIWPAQEAGFRTALFAGDERSLRKRDGDPRVAGVEPDLVLTSLGQLRECIISS
ncbi:MAG: haloacid dehalogenase [Planctomycetaceae bacterium]|nr:haloacid dehalogenase [Planctomycetaceae bacterium]